MNHLEKWLNLNAPLRTFGKGLQDLVKTKPKKSKSAKNSEMS